MENNFNIEELFRNNLEHAEAQPPAGAWEAIQAKMGLASAAAGTAATGLGIGKIAAIVAITLGVGLGVGYLALRDNGQENKTSNHPPVQEITNNTETTVPTQDEQVEITNISSAQKADKIVSIVEIKKGEEKKTIRVEEPVKVDKNGSVVNQWLTPEKEKAKAEQMMQRILEEAKKADKKENTDLVESPTKKEDKSLFKSVENTHVEAAINYDTDQENPLMFSFSNIIQAASYEWNFGDGTTSRQPNPVHTYNAPGNYSVALKVYDKNGKAYSDSKEIIVSGKEENLQEVSSIDKPNIFTPNGDGIDDEFYFTGKNIESFMVTIVSPYGKTVYSSTDINQHWNGTDKSGAAVPSGNYSYICKAVGKDGKVHTNAGTVTVSR